MAHIMIGYELGGGHGHLYRPLPPVRALEAQGHRVTMNGEIFARGMTDEVASALQRPGLIVHREFQPLPELLARASVVLHHGSNRTSCAAMSAGRPQIVIPTQMGSRLMGDAVTAQGCGRLLTGRQASADGLRQALEVVAADSEMARRAAALALQIGARGCQQPLEKFLDACSAVLEGATAPDARAWVAH